MTTELLIDEQAASFVLEPAALRSWGQRQRIFVSSLITDLPEERRAVRDAIESVGAQPVMFEEELGAQDISAADAYLGGVRSSTVYVGIFGARYGARTSRGYSATEEEFREAERLGLRLCIFANTAGAEVDGAQRDLIDGARNMLTTSQWTDPADLARRLLRRLADLAAEELAPWVRLGDTVFRASKVSVDGDTITVEAVVQNPRITARLNDMRNGRASDLRFTSPDDSRTVQLNELRTSMTSTASRTVTLILVAGKHEQPMTMGTTHVNGVSYTQQDLARLAMSDALFGTNDYPTQWGMGSTSDPLEPIRRKGLIDQVVRPVTRLLIVDMLLRRGDASHIDSFQLGPDRSGKRTLRLSWTPPRLYTNDPTPASVSIEGIVAGL
jgi:hypothetical protein